MCEDNLKTGAKITNDSEGTLHEELVLDELLEAAAAGISGPNSLKVVLLLDHGGKNLYRHDIYRANPAGASEVARTL